jgi:hypothetical protein
LAFFLLYLGGAKAEQDGFFWGNGHYWRWESGKRKLTGEKRTRRSE